MKVKDLIRKLENLDPEAVVVKFNAEQGYDDVTFIVGTHTEQGIWRHLRLNRAKWVKGENRPDYLCFDDQKPSKAKKLPFLLLY